MIKKMYLVVGFLFFVIVIVLFANISVFYPYTFDGNPKPVKNVILISWAGTQRNHLYELLNDARLPNLQKIIDEGTIANITVTTGKTLAKPGLAEILTGYGPEITGVYSNHDYKPIPKGYTIFERLEDHFGKDNIVTMFISTETNNVGARGPHKICVNCYGKYEGTTIKTDWYLETTTVPTVGGGPKIFEEREGEPFYYTKNTLDVYYVPVYVIADLITSLDIDSKTTAKTIEFLEEYKDKRFFMFVMFEEADLKGHWYGENSEEYGNGIINVDYSLGKIVSKLNELGLYDETLIYVTSTHGLDEDGFDHTDAPYIFMATNDKLVKTEGDRKDITPTLLWRYGFRLEDISPAVDGIPLIK